MIYKFKKGDAVIVTGGQALGKKGTITGIQTAAQKYPYYVILPGETISHLYAEDELAKDFSNVPIEPKERMSVTWALIILFVILCAGVYAIVFNIASQSSEQRADVLSDTVARIPYDNK